MRERVLHFHQVTYAGTQGVNVEDGQVTTPGVQSGEGRMEGW